MHCREYYPIGQAWHRVVTANLSLRKKYIEKAGGFGRDFVFWGSEDVDLGYRLGQLKMRLIWDDKIRVYHIHHPKESDLDLNVLCWLGTNLLYRKYFDREIYDVYGENILRRLDNLIIPDK